MKYFNTFMSTLQSWHSLQEYSSCKGGSMSTIPHPSGAPCSVTQRHHITAWRENQTNFFRSDINYTREWFQTLIKSRDNCTLPRNSFKILPNFFNVWKIIMALEVMGNQGEGNKGHRLWTVTVLVIYVHSFIYFSKQHIGDGPLVFPMLQTGLGLQEGKGITQDHSFRGRSWGQDSPAST